MIKCGVCGSENEAAALFCGTCGSPLSPAEAKAIADDAAQTTVSTTPEPDEAVVPGKGGARRDLGTGGEAAPRPEETVTPPPPPEEISEAETVPGGPTITCGVCGTVNDATRTYCRKCANELRPAPPPPPPPPPPPTPRRISPLAIGLGAAAVVVAVALIAVLAMGGGKPGATEGPSALASAGTTQLPSAQPTAGPTILPTATARTFTEGALSGQIAFTRCAPGGGGCAIYLRPANASAKARLIIGATSGAARDPSISHDGTKIAYSVSTGLRVVTISTRKYVDRPKGAGDTNPDWSPNDSQLVFSGHRSADGSDLEIRLSGSTGTKASILLTDNDVMDHDPVFTPDGKSIVWVQGEGDRRELKMIDIASKTVTDLTSDAFDDVDPAVSPLGNEIVFSSKRGSGAEFDLFLMDLTTHAISALPAMSGDEHDPSWSPGGRYIVFSGGEKGNENLFILDLSTMKTTTFTSVDGADQYPFWR